MADIDAQTLGERIRDARKRADLSQEDLGKAVGLERTVVNKIEMGVRRVTALELSNIAAAIGVRMSTFFEEPVPALVAHRSSQGLDTADSQIDVLLAKFANEVEFVASLGVNELGLDAVDAVSETDIRQPSTNAEAEALALKARHLMALSEEEPIRELSESVASVGLRPPRVAIRDSGRGRCLNALQVVSAHAGSAWRLFRCGAASPRPARAVAC